MSNEEIATTLQLSKLRVRPKTKLICDGKEAYRNSDKDETDEENSLAQKCELRECSDDSDPDFTISKPYQKFAKNGKKRGRGRPPKVEDDDDIEPGMKPIIKLEKLSIPKPPRVRKKYYQSRVGRKQIKPPKKLKYSFCRLCKMPGLNTREAYAEHVMKVHQENNVCLICKKSFPDGSVKLVSHISHHHPPNKDFKCEVCGKAYAFQEQLDKHSQKPGIHDKSRWLHKCNDCGERFFLHEEMLKHRREAHINRTTKAHYCSVCNKGYAKRDSLKAHFNTHLKISPHTCDFESCGKKFTTRYHLLRHMRLHTSRETYPCPICGIAFPIIEYVKRHIDRAHLKKSAHSEDFIARPRVRCGGIYIPRVKHVDTMEPKEVDVYQSKTAQNVVTKIENLAPSGAGRIIVQKSRGVEVNPFIPAHRTTEELDLPPEVKVEGNVVQIDTLKSYSYAISDIQEHKCPFCYMGFSRVHLLREHLFKVHGETNFDNLDEILPTTCDYCGFLANDKRELNDHLRKNHAGKKFGCPHCGVRFADKAVMNRHINRIHNTEPEHQCSKCEKRFHSRARLKTHLQRVHEEAGIYECQVCHRTLKTKLSFIAHKKLHDKSRKLSVCNLCGEKLSCNTSLRRHVGLIHSKDAKLGTGRIGNNQYTHLNKTIPISNEVITCDIESEKITGDAILGF